MFLKLTDVKRRVAEVEEEVSARKLAWWFEA